MVGFSLSQTYNSFSNNIIFCCSLLSFRTVTFWQLMQQFYRLEGKVENQFQHMEDDIEELKSKVKNGPQEGSRKETEAMKIEIENLSEDFERAQRDVSNIGIIQIILSSFFYIFFFVIFIPSSLIYYIVNVFSISCMATVSGIFLCVLFAK